MPCNSSYLKQTNKEFELQRAARLFKFVLEKLGKKVPKQVKETSEAYYASVDFVPDLCQVLSSLSETELNTIVYNARNKTARDLADWWEEHQEADREREEQEKEAKNREKIKKQALKKLTPAEREALGLNNPFK